MRTLSNTTGSKKVNITEKDGTFTAMYVQVYKGQEQVLQSMRYKTLKGATNYANYKLN